MTNITKIYLPERCKLLFIDVCIVANIINGLKIEEPRWQGARYKEKGGYNGCKNPLL